MNTSLSILSGLDEFERIEAQRTAKEHIIARHEQPTRERFKDYNISKYPKWFTGLILGLLVISLLSAALPSAFNLYRAGYQHFILAEHSNWQAAIVGFSTFILAETTVIISTVAASVLVKGRNRFWFAVPIVIGSLLALIGNWSVMIPETPFDILATLSPPILTLCLAYVLERLVIQSLKDRHANEVAYKRALTEYQMTIKDPERDPSYRGVLANAYRDAIAAKNSAGRGKTERMELMSRLTPMDWKQLVMREFEALEWFELDAPAIESEASIQPANFTLAPSQNGHTNGNGNGHKIQPITELNQI